MNVWITNVSTSKFAGVNTLWAAIMREDFIPDRVHLIADEMVKEKGYSYCKPEPSVGWHLWRHK